MEIAKEELEDKVKEDCPAMKCTDKCKVSDCKIHNPSVIDHPDIIASIYPTESPPGSVENFKIVQALTNQKIPKEKSEKYGFSNKVNKHLVTENQERINYLFLASSFINNSDYKLDLRNISASLGTMSMAIGRKCVLRMSPTMKRQMCKGCGSAILPAISSTYRLRKNRHKHLVVTCNKCSTIKRFVTNSNYMLWSENPNSVI